MLDLVTLISIFFGIVASPRYRVYTKLPNETRIPEQNLTIVIKAEQLGTVRKSFKISMPSFIQMNRLIYLVIKFQASLIAEYYTHRQ